jgi:hypothetical protein
MRMVMHLCFMRRMVVVVGTMLPGMLVLMYVDISSMTMFMWMFMEVLVGVGMGVFMGVHDIPMAVFMAVLMSVFVGMQMLVFVCPFHRRPSFRAVRAVQKLREVLTHYEAMPLLPAEPAGGG